MSPEQFTAATQLKNSPYRTFCQFISKVHCEIVDPSDPNKKIGIVRLGTDKNCVYELTDKDLADEFGTSPAVIMHNRESLHDKGLIALKQTGRGYKLVIRNSGMFNYVARTAENGYSWIYDIPEFSEHRPAPRVPKTETQPIPDDEATHENGDPSHQNGESRHQNGESGHQNGESGAPNPSEDKGDTSLIKRIKGIERIKPIENPLPSFSNEQDIRASKDGPEFVRLAERLGQIAKDEASLRKKLAVATPKRTKEQAESLADRVIQCCSEGGGGLLDSFQKRELITVIQSKQGYSDEVWLRAVSTILSELSGMDDKGFHLGHASKKIAASIVPYLPKAKKAYQEAALQPLLMDRLAAEGRMQVLADFVAREKKESAEEAMWEDELDQLKPLVKPDLKMAAGD